MSNRKKLVFVASKSIDGSVWLIRYMTKSGSHIHRVAPSSSSIMDLLAEVQEEQESLGNAILWRNEDTANG